MEALKTAGQINDPQTGELEADTFFVNEIPGGGALIPIHDRKLAPVARLHFNSGHTVGVALSNWGDAETALEDIALKLDASKPHWFVLENLIFHTQGLACIEID